jgi:aspartyl protease family protein
VGHVVVPITISNPADASLKSEVDALVDTGATVTVVPRRLADALKLPVTGRGRVRTATGEISLDRAGAFIQINGEGALNPIVISDTIDKVLVGVVTLETLALTVNPKTGELKEAELLWY